jgi:hypothetical protein
MIRPASFFLVDRRSRTTPQLMGFFATWVVVNSLLLAGCGSPVPGEPALVMISARVEAFDPDGTLFETRTSGRPFEKTTSSLGPLTLVKVVTPADLAGREYLIALPLDSQNKTVAAAAQLTEKGRVVTIGLIRTAVRKGPREVVEFSELVLPGGPPRAIGTGGAPP